MLLLAYSPGLLSLLSYTTQDHLPKGDTAHRDLGPLTSIKAISHRRSLFLVLLRYQIHGILEFHFDLLLLGGVHIFQ